MDNDGSKVLESILKLIKLETMQEIDEYILTISSINPSIKVGRNGCMTRCFLLYLMKHKIFKYTKDEKSTTNVIVQVTKESISLYYEIISKSAELKSLIFLALENDLIIVARNRDKLLALIE